MTYTRIIKEKELNIYTPTTSRSIIVEDLDILQNPYHLSACIAQHIGANKLQLTANTGFIAMHILKARDNLCTPVVGV